MTVQFEKQPAGLVYAVGEIPQFDAGDAVRVCERRPIGHYRVPIYLRGKRGTVVQVITPTGVDNEEEGFGRNAGASGYYYRICVPLGDIWPDYVGSRNDGLYIELFESWIEEG